MALQITKLILLLFFGSLLHEGAIAQTFRGVFDTHGTSEGVTAGVGFDYFAVDPGTVQETLSCIPKARPCPGISGYTWGYTLIAARSGTFIHAFDFGRTGLSSLKTRSQASAGITIMEDKRRFHVTLKLQPKLLSLYLKPAIDMPKKDVFLDVGLGVSFF